MSAPPEALRHSGRLFPPRIRGGEGGMISDGVVSGGFGGF